MRSVSVSAKGAESTGRPLRTSVVFWRFKRLGLVAAFQLLGYFGEDTAIPVQMSAISRKAASDVVFDRGPRPGAFKALSPFL